MSIASFFCQKCGAGYHAHEGHECKAAWRVIAPDGREWRNPRLMAAVSAAIEETKLQFPVAAPVCERCLGFGEVNFRPCEQCRTAGVKAVEKPCGAVCRAGQQDGIACADDECDRENGTRPAGVVVPDVETFCTEKSKP